MGSNIISRVLNWRSQGRGSTIFSVNAIENNRDGRGEAEQQTDDSLDPNVSEEQLIDEGHEVKNTNCEIGEEESEAKEISFIRSGKATGSSIDLWKK